ncbi:flagellar biosynthesis protein FliR [compost metagenome]
MLAINLVFGVLSRAAPALNPMQLGLPVALLIGLSLLTLLAGEMGPPVQRLFDTAFDTARQVTM